MSHTAGLSGWEQPVTFEDICDWDKATSLLAAQAPWWEPGSASGYHALTQGYLVGEVVRRVTGQSLGTFLAKEVAGPVGADFHVGLGARALRPGRQRDPAAAARPSRRTRARSSSRRSATPSSMPTWAWRPEWRQAEIPAANGHGNARSLAQIHAVLACGGEANGVRFLSPAGVRRRSSVSRRAASTS